MLNFDQNGVLIPPAPPSTAEVDNVYAFAKASDPEQNGLALSHLRTPNSKVSLQRIEAIALTLVASGRMTSQRVFGQRGGYYDLYTWK